MRKSLLVTIVGLLLTSFVLSAVHVSADGGATGLFPNRTIEVIRSPPGGPRTDTVQMDIVPPVSGLWWVSADSIAGSALIVQVYRNDAGLLTLESSAKLRYGGDASPQVTLSAPLEYVAAFTPFGKAGTSVLREHFSGPPIAQYAFSPTAPTNRDVIVFDASASVDLDNAIVAYDWDFGDGSVGSGVRVEHLYPTPDAYTVNLTVTDETGLSAKASQTVVVSLARNPFAAFTVTRDLMSVSVDASASFDADGTIVSYAWNFGDGGTASGVTATHTYLTPGAYTIILTARDDDGLEGTATRGVTVNTMTVDWTYSDFFAVPYGEWWDMRTFFWDDQPIGAECFSQGGIDRGFCSATDPARPDIASAPYTNWFVGSVGDAAIYAPYRFQVAVKNHPAYTIDRPVILPTCEDLQASGLAVGVEYPCIVFVQPPSGGTVGIDLQMQYLTIGRELELLSAQGCPDVLALNDGFLMEVRLSLTMDGTAAARLFGVTDGAQWAPGSADTSLISAGCGPADPTDAKSGKLEKAYAAWLSATANSPYDVFNAFRVPFQNFAVQADGMFDSGTGQHKLTVTFIGWGHEALFARWAYWGATSYRDGVLLGAAPAGWSGIEPISIEDLRLTGTIGASFSATASGVLQYHFVHLADAGADSTYYTGDDVPKWVWRPALADRLYTSAAHPASELATYLGLTYTHSTVGSRRYGTAFAFDYVPALWPLMAGETQTFWFPTGSVVLYDGGRSPLSNDPKTLVALGTTIALTSSVPPSGVGEYDAVARVLSVLGPTVVGMAPTNVAGKPLESRPIYNLGAR